MGYTTYCLIRFKDDSSIWVTVCCEVKEAKAYVKKNIFKVSNKKVREIVAIGSEEMSQFFYGCLPKTYDL